MKVLLYAVFKDHEGCNLLAIASHVAGELGEVRSLKAERCSTLADRYRSAEMVDPLIREPAHPSTGLG